MRHDIRLSFFYELSVLQEFLLLFLLLSSTLARQGKKYLPRIRNERSIFVWL